MGSIEEMSLYRISLVNSCEGCESLTHLDVLGWEQSQSRQPEERGAPPGGGTWILLPFLLLIHWWPFPSDRIATAFWKARRRVYKFQTHYYLRDKLQILDEVFH